MKIVCLTLLAMAYLNATRSRAAEGDSLRVRGRVLDPDGKPVPGAAVTVPSTPNWNDRTTRTPVARTTSGPEGRFEITFNKAVVSPFTTGGGSPGGDAWKHAQIVATAEGFGVAFARWDRTDADGQLVLRLVRDDVPIEGRVVGADGAAVPGVHVAVMSVGADRQTIEEAYRKYAQDPGDLTLYVPFGAAGRNEPIVTDADGRFRVTGVGRDRRVEMRLSGPTIGYTKVEAMTRVMEPVRVGVPQPTGDAPQMVTYGAKFEFTATPGRTVRGVVRDAASGEPMAGVTVQSLRFAGPFQGYDPQGLLTCVTGADGRYTLDGFPKGQGNEIIAVPNDEQPYFMQEAAVQDEPGVAPVTIDLVLHKGVFVTGKVTDNATGKGLPARLLYTTYLDNPHTHNLPEFRREQGAGFLDGYQSRYETKPDGAYRIVAAPGKAIIGVWCMLEGYRKGVGFDQIPIFAEKNFVFRMYQPPPYPQGTDVVKEVDVPPDAQSVTCDLELDRGGSVHVAVLDPDGKPVARPLEVRGTTPENYVGWHGKQVDGPEFDAGGFAPDEERTLFVIDPAQSLGRAVTVRFADVKDGKVTVQLQPLAHLKGRVLDSDGKPLPDIDLDPRVHAKGGGRSLKMFKTDEQGRFQTPLLPGARYYVSVWAGPYVGATVAEEQDPQAGATVDLGDVKIKPYITR